MKVKQILFTFSSTAVTNGWSDGITLTANTTENIQFVRLTKDAGMNVDFGDVRFIIDPDGTGSELLFLDYELLTSDVTYLYYKVAHPNYFSTPSAVFYAIWGNPDATSESNPYRTSLSGGWLYNDGSRGINFDVVNVLGGYDKLLAGPGDASTEKNWPAICQDPNDKLKLFLIYKDDANNAHSGTATSKVSLIKSTDGGVTWGSPITVADPAAADIGATNAVITSVYDGATLVLIVVFAYIDFTSFIPRTYATRSIDGGDTWSAPSQVGPDRWINVGGQAITLSDGVTCLFGSHQDGDDTAGEWRATIIRTIDYGITFDYIEIPSPTNTKLNETAMVELKDSDTREYFDPPVVRLIHRNEDATTYNHQYKSDLTGSPTMSVTTAVENDWFDSQGKESRFTATRLLNGRIIFAGGDQVGKMLYSDDECQSFHPFPYDILRTSIYSARRNYLVMAEVGENGELFMAWASNKLTDGSDLYGNFFDGYNMSLRAVANATLTDSRTRPFDLNPGIRVNGSLVAGYRTTSVTSNSIPTSHPTQVTFTVAAGLSYVAGQSVLCNRTSTTFFLGTVNSYSGTTLVVDSTSNTGTGTSASWVIDLQSNLLSDQALVSGWSRNGKVSPFKTKFTAKLPVLGWVGIKKDEVRALAVVTISNAGSTGDIIRIKWAKTSTYSGSIAGLGIVAQHTVQSGDAISDVVAGLVASANLIGVCPVSTSDATTLTLRAPRGNGATINGIALTITATGTVAGSSGNFASGASAEGVTSIQNVLNFNHSSNNAVIEQANDGFTSSLTAPKDSYNEYVIDWDTTLITMTVNSTSVTKTSVQGSGICDFDGMPQLYTSTSNTFPQGYVEITKIVTEPLDQTIPTEGATISGSWTERSDGRGIQ